KRALSWICSLRTPCPKRVAERGCPIVKGLKGLAVNWLKPTPIASGSERGAAETRPGEGRAILVEERFRGVTLAPSQIKGEAAGESPFAPGEPRADDA